MEKNFSPDEPFPNRFARFIDGRGQVRSGAVLQASQDLPLKRPPGCLGGQPRRSSVGSTSVHPGGWSRHPRQPDIGLHKLRDPGATIFPGFALFSCPMIFLARDEPFRVVFARLMFEGPSKRWVGLLIPSGAASPPPKDNISTMGAVLAAGTLEREAQGGGAAPMEQRRSWAPSRARPQPLAISGLALFRAFRPEASLPHSDPLR